MKVWGRQEWLGKATGLDDVAALKGAGCLGPHGPPWTVGKEGQGSTWPGGGRLEQAFLAVRRWARPGQGQRQRLLEINPEPLRRDGVRGK